MVGRRGGRHPRRVIAVTLSRSASARRRALAAALTAARAATALAPTGSVAAIGAVTV
jgi:hypothetical protein